MGVFTCVDARRASVLILGAALLFAPVQAKADTLVELAEQAVPWQETINAYGREIVIDVTPQVPQARQLDEYRVTTVRVQEDCTIYDSREMPPKRRGYAFRSKPEEVFLAEEIDPSYQAFGNPMTAGGVLALCAGFMEEAQAQTNGIVLAPEILTCSSPAYLFDKNTGVWGDTVFEGDVGSYILEYAMTLDGTPVLGSASVYREELIAGSADDPTLPYWRTYARVDAPDDYVMCAVMPRVEESIRQDVKLVALDAVKDVLRDLAERGLLRELYGMELVYAAFDCGLEDAWLMKPVWRCKAEIYHDAEEGRMMMGAEEWYLTYDVIIDAQTGELIGKMWAELPEGMAWEATSAESE